jgi:hypothetical protein
MSLTKKQLYDYRDIAPAELKVIRVGHFLWLRYKNARNRGDASESADLAASLEAVWAAKRVLRAELKVKRAEASRKMAEYFKGERTCQS